MRPHFVLTAFAIVLLMVMTGADTPKGRVKKGARCTGSSTCDVCENCNSCKYCSQNGGTCGVKRNDQFRQRQERPRRRRDRQRRNRPRHRSHRQSSLFTVFGYPPGVSFLSDRDGVYGWNLNHRVGNLGTGLKWDGYGGVSVVVDFDAGAVTHRCWPHASDG